MAPVNTSSVDPKADTVTPAAAVTPAVAVVSGVAVTAARTAAIQGPRNCVCGCCQANARPLCANATATQTSCQRWLRGSTLRHGASIPRESYQRCCRCCHSQIATLSKRSASRSRQLVLAPRSWSRSRSSSAHPSLGRHRELTDEDSGDGPGVVVGLLSNTGVVVGL